MAEEAEPTTTGVVIKVLAALLKAAKDQGLLAGLITALKAKPRILLLGCSGTGKTNFLQSLVTLLPEPIAREDRTLYTQAKNVMMKRQAYRFIDTTGDVARDSDRKQAIREAMSAKGGIAGIINVVCYGYHEYQVTRNKVLAADSTVKPEYLELHRQEEIKQLSEWTEIPGDRLTAGWLITVVNKADLWWPEREKVIAHYANGDYWRSLGSAQVLKPRVLPYCSVFQRFYGEAAMSGIFDQKDRDKCRERLINALVKALLTKQGV